ncbi:unnamed protein product [Closterium sp. NIES-65]|nr:unnamed protein product [Closterium sp. NIES-65]
MASLLGSATSQCRVPVQHALTRQPATPNAAGRAAFSRRSLAIRSSVDDSVNGRRSDPSSQEHSPAAAAAAETAGVSRRSVLLAPAASAAAAVALSLGIAATAAPESAQAFGLAGPKEWLKAQKRKSMQFLLNPLMVSSARLAAAKAEFEAFTTPSELASVQARVREPSLDCLSSTIHHTLLFLLSSLSPPSSCPTLHSLTAEGSTTPSELASVQARLQEPSLDSLSSAIHHTVFFPPSLRPIHSFIAEASTTPSELASVQAGVREASLDCLAPGFTPGVELCTFKLILKNAASLLDKNDPALVLGEEALLDLIWSFRQLHGLLDEAQGSDPPPR